MTKTTNTADGEPKCTIFIDYVADLEVWHAVWSNQDGFVADFDSQSEEEVVAWARERCDELWLRRPPPGGLHPLTPSGWARLTVRH